MDIPPGPKTRFERPHLGFRNASRLPGSEGLSIQKAKQAQEDFRAACFDKHADAQTLESLGSLLTEAGFRHEMTDILIQALPSPDINPQVGPLWIRRLVTSSGWNRTYPKYLDELYDRGEIGRRAVLEFAAYLGTKCKPKLTRRLAARHGHWLHEDALGWVLMAAALSKAGLYRRAIAWTREWKKRPETDTRVIFARALALRGLGRDRSSIPIIQAALQRPEALQEFPMLGIWNAMELGLASKTAEARAQLNQLQPAGWDDDSFCMYYLTRGVVRIQETPKADRKEAFASAAGRLRDRFHRVRAHQRHVLLRRAYRRCMWRMSMDAGIWWRGLVAPWKSADSALMLAPLTVIPPLQLLLPVYLYRLLTKRHAQSR